MLLALDQPIPGHRGRMGGGVGRPTSCRARSSPAQLGSMLRLGLQPEGVVPLFPLARFAVRQTCAKRLT